MVRRTKDEAEQTRIAILDAAEDVFFQNGVAKTSLEQIARAANVTRGAVYWHFKDKIELCEAMMRRVFLPQEEILERLSASEGPTPLKDLEQSCCEALKQMGKDKRRQRVVSIMMMKCEYVDDMAQILTRRRDCKDRMFDQLLHMFQRAHKLGQLPTPWTPRLATIALQSLMSGIINGVLEGRKDLNFQTSGVDCIRAFFASLQPKAAAKAAGKVKS
ncbi:MAG: TetR family transcriptional regulator [Alphaproteobacteria bacterium]|nr:TetR family transcriptional regulator [Alphaproteobacteria bacterium]MBV8548334.1 TetR family transcriptional regulator [Alphaproteobacteria bacterium]